MSRPDQTAALLRSWHQGDEEALESLLRRDLPWIQAQVRRRLGPALRARAETMDVVQDAMVQVLRDKPRFLVGDQQNFRGLIAAIIENLLRHRARDQRRERRDVAREERLASTGVIDLDATSASQAAVRAEETSWLELAVELLDPEARQAIVLRQWQGLSFAELGTELRVSEDAARKRFGRALAQLAPLMKRLQEGGLAQLLAERQADSGEPPTGR